MDVHASELGSTSRDIAVAHPQRPSPDPAEEPNPLEPGDQGGDRHTRPAESTRAAPPRNRNHIAVQPMNSIFGRGRLALSAAFPNIIRKAQA